MKLRTTIMIVFLLSFCADLFAQKILMKGPAPIPAAGEEILALSCQMSTTPSFIGGGGGSQSKVSINDLVVKKKIGASTLPFFNKVTVGNGTIDYLKFEYLDETNKPYYIITIGSETVTADKGVLVTDLRWLSPECPTCVGMDQQVSFAFTSITIEDVIRKTKATYNVVTNSLK
jgi:hypothetical protein